MLMLNLLMHGMYKNIFFNCVHTCCKIFCCITSKKDCLRRLVIVLTEQNRIHELCEFKYTGLEREVCLCVM